MSEFPERGCYRGLNGYCFKGDSSNLRNLHISAFEFKKNQLNKYGESEASITWARSLNSLIRVGKQCKLENDNRRVPQFTKGSIRLPLWRLEEIQNDPGAYGRFRYEPAAILECKDGNEPNPDHGNLLMNLVPSSEAPKPAEVNRIRRYVMNLLVDAAMKELDITDADELPVEERPYVDRKTLDGLVPSEYWTALMD